MTIYETIKAAISVKQAAEHYGLKVSRNGMACCPFHHDGIELEAERGLFLLLWLRSQGGCDRLRGKVVQSEQL